MEIKFSRTWGQWPKKPTNRAEWAVQNGQFLNTVGDIIDIASFVTGNYPISQWYSGARSADNFICGQVLGVDKDDSRFASSVAEQLESRFVQYNAAIVHTTQSHRPEAPRCRVLFVADEPISDAVRYRRYTSALAWYMQGDTAATDAARIFQGCGVTGEVHILGNTVPLDFLETLAEDRESSFYTGYRNLDNRIVGHQELRDWLFRIPPDVDYDTWVRCLMAVHGAAPNEEGLRIVEDWTGACIDPSHAQRLSSLRSKFMGFKRDNGVGVGTLVYLAKQLGGDNGQAVG